MITTINQEVVTVGVGDLKVAGIPKILKTSLGSCVGVVLYDNVIKVGVCSISCFQNAKTEMGN